ncbi:MAG: PAS domain S-box protein [Gammaproteobacteria bacterium]|jgi:PAS domain S-box-containing protein|nr:PAS domain S-box protein [Gammaproteobacteria bacterium]
MDNSSSQKSKSPLKQKVLDSHSDLLSKYANDIILLTDNDWQILKVNDKALSVYQYDISEIVGMLVTKLEKIDERNEEVELDFSFKNGFLYEAVHIKKDGTTFPVEISLRTMRVEGVRYKQLIVRDITERKIKEKELRQYENIVSASKDMMAILDTEYRYLAINNKYMQAFNKQANEIIGHTLSDLFGEKVFSEAIKHRVDACLTGEEVRYQNWFDFPGTGKRYLDVHNVPYYDENEQLSGYVVNARDISDFKLAEEKLQQNEEKYRELVEDTNVMSWEADIVTAQFTYMSPQAEKLTGFRSEEWCQEGFWEQRIYFEDRDGALRFCKESVARGEDHSFEYRMVKADGGLIWIGDNVKIVYDEKGTAIKLRGVMIDITDRKEVEEELDKTALAVEVLRSCSSAMIRAESELELVQHICDAVTSIDGYTYAWFGYAENDDIKSVSPVAQSGFDSEQFASAKFTWDDSPNGCSPTGEAIKSREYVVSQDILNDPSCAYARDVALDKGFKSLIALPLKLGDESSIGVLEIYSDKLEIFTEDAISLLQQLANDLTFGIKALRTTAQKNEYSEQLAGSLTETIETIALTVEMRDPYTSGHMRRVAALCVAIAEKMGLPENEISGIELCASIHDLGKIYIPSEILNRPGKLTAAEFDIIKTHSQVGYDIVKGIKLPWPVADMILQHHEKLDGSGYPQGLQGDEICQGAKIIIVADIVEAISSHRPYRPALGIEVGIEHIKKSKGVQYASEVVDACIEVFEMDNFEFADDKRA